ncbi:hypothetical protein IAR55_000990 [Kwoniella newhampshirensis]|uniref:phosphoribosylglycinamide formyltransferase 1 n=1 Tax=Kwoniella newhampshirensis TaxID=1651941 RepID=A0AAW0Z4G2_9TREE
MTTLHETIVPTPPVRRITVLISGSGTNLQALLDAAETPRLPNAAITYVLSSRSNAFGLTRAKTHNPPIPTSVCALKTFLSRNPGSTREHYDAEVARQVLDSRPDIVVLAGWMHILSDRFLEVLNGERQPPPAPALPPPHPNSLPTQTEPIPSASSPIDGHPASSLQSKSLPAPPHTQHFPIPIINLHPALPGAFDGANAIGRALEAFQKGEVKNTGVMVHRVVAEVDRGEPLLVREVEIKAEDTLEGLEARIHQVEHEIIVDGARVVLEELNKDSSS